MSALKWFDSFYAEVRKTKNWSVMEGTVEGSEWHREANVAVHTDMCIQHYIKTTAAQRTERQQVMTLVTLLFHDFGKPEAEETLTAKDGSDRTYHRYAGHEPKSANEFLSFMMSHKGLTQTFFDQGFTWNDVRAIKWMIEHHLPFGLKNPTKRANLKCAFEATLSMDDGQCFYDQLWSDCNGRISDDHETKRANVLTWIEEFKMQKAALYKPPKADAPVMWVLIGPVGAGKSTWSSSLAKLESFEIVSEDSYRIEYAHDNMSPEVREVWRNKSDKEVYAQAWQFCFDSNGGYDKYAKAQLMGAVASRRNLVLDRTNQTRKSRSRWIQAAKQAGYRIQSVEFFVSENLSQARQKSRQDKDVPPHRTHSIYMAFEVPWDYVEVDGHMIIPTFD